MADLYVCPHGQTRPCSQCDLPTDEEAEAVLREHGTSGKEVVNGFIDQVLRERLWFEEAIKTFIRNRGKHEGEHVFDLIVCQLCDESYVQAEAVLDATVKPDAPVTPVAQPEADPVNWLTEDRCMFCGGKTAHEPNCSHGREPSTTTPTTTAIEAVNAAAMEICDYCGTDQNDSEKVAAIISKHLPAQQPEVEVAPKTKIGQPDILTVSGERYVSFAEYARIEKLCRSVCKDKIALADMLENRDDEADAEVSRLKGEVERLKADLNETGYALQKVQNSWAYLDARLAAATEHAKILQQEAQGARADAIGECVDAISDVPVTNADQTYKTAWLVKGDCVAALEQLKGEGK